ncbi:MAG: ABC transporter ATP-binding protein [Phocaeicola sp.]
MVIVENLSVKYDQRTLFSNLAFQVVPGESICICGESGSGKSSLLKALAGFVPFDRGSIFIDQLELNEKNIDEVRKRIAFVPQELSLPTEWVYDMIRLPFNLKINRNSEFDEKKLMGFFEELGLDKKLYHKRVIEISGGERQRIMLAATAMFKKKVLLVDEPTSALDAQSTLLVIDFFKRLCREDQISIVAVSHDERFAVNCHKIIQL